MMRSEAEFRRSLVRSLRPEPVMIAPIETGTTALGIPDVFLRTEHKSTWIELKCVHYEPDFPYTISFRPGQYRWLRKYHLMGGNSVLGVATPIGLYFMKNLDIKEIYPKPFHLYLETLYQGRFNGKQFLKWVDE